jgi:hypothetical protein
MTEICLGDRCGSSNGAGFGANHNVINLPQIPMDEICERQLFDPSLLLQAETDLAGQ